VTHPVCIPTVAIRRLKNRGPRFSAPLAYGEPAIKSTDRTANRTPLSPTQAAKASARSRLSYLPAKCRFPDSWQTIQTVYRGADVGGLIAGLRDIAVAIETHFLRLFGANKKPTYRRLRPQKALVASMWVCRLLWDAF
jgi:hypothetical protein